MPKFGLVWSLRCSWIYDVFARLTYTCVFQLLLAELKLLQANLSRVRRLSPLRLKHVLTFLLYTAWHKNKLMSTASYNIIETYARHCNVVSYLRVVVKVIWISFLLCPIGECCIVIMCLYIYPQAYRRNCMPTLNQIFVLLLMATIGPLLVVLRYVLPFLWMISYLHIMVRMLILLQLQATVYWSNTFVSTRWLFFAVASILS